MVQWSSPSEPEFAAAGPGKSVIGGARFLAIGTPVEWLKVHGS